MTELALLFGNPLGGPGTKRELGARGGSSKRRARAEKSQERELFTKTEEMGCAKMGGPPPPRDNKRRSATFLVASL